MVIRRLMGEWSARTLLVLLISALLAAILVAQRPAHAIEIHALMPEQGGWLPGTITVQSGMPVALRLISDDVMHGFAVGRQSWPAVNLIPGEMVELTLTFDEPGTYVFYCTRWCGPNHWRMRGTIEVVSRTDDLLPDKPEEQPPFLSLGLDIDAPHKVDVRLSHPPSASRGESLSDIIPPDLRTSDVYWARTPFEVWQVLRLDPAAAELSDAALWDVVAYLWRRQASPESLKLGQRLYAENCAACHGENGDGRGVFAASPSTVLDDQLPMKGILPPQNFVDSRQMLGANSALLEGKILRGGMGTGMPSWGNVFTDEEIEALVGAIWAFQFPVETRSPHP